MPNVSYRSVGLIEIEKLTSPPPAIGQDADWPSFAGALATLARRANSDGQRVASPVSGRHLAGQKEGAKSQTVAADLPKLAQELHAETVALVIEIFEARRRESHRRW